MKTQRSEVNEMRVQGIVMVAFYVLVMAGVMIMSGGKSLEAVMSLNASETGRAGEKSVKEAASPAGTVSVESEIYMNNLYEALLPVAEPEMAVMEMMEIPFPDLAGEISIFAFEDDNFIKELLDAKNTETAAECALMFELRNCLVKEPEQPLKVESWMIDESRWNHDSK